MINLQDGRYRQLFILDKPLEKCTRFFSAVLRQQRESDVMTYFGSPLAAPSIIAGSPLKNIEP
jgi:hypothetical protein